MPTLLRNIHYFWVTKSRIQWQIIRIGLITQHSNNMIP